MANQAMKLREAVQSALAADPPLRDASLSVTVEDGVVTLGGWVEQPEQRARAQAVAQAVPGVREVVNSLRVGSAQRGAGRMWDALTGHDLDEAHDKIQRKLGDDS